MADKYKTTSQDHRVKAFLQRENSLLSCRKRDVLEGLEHFRSLTWGMDLRSAESVPSNSSNRNTKVTCSDQEKSNARLWDYDKSRVEWGAVIVKVDQFGAQYVLERHLSCSFLTEWMCNQDQATTKELCTWELARKLTVYQRPKHRFICRT